MSVVVTDSGPIHYLVLCGAVDIVPKLYGQLVIPKAVARELAHANTPPAVSHWINSMPQWASVASPIQIDPAAQLGIGEREAIALAVELKAAQLLVDDRAARRVAVQRGVSTSGTIAVLEQAAVCGFLKLPTVMLKLLTTNFRIDSGVVREVLARDSARRRLARE